LRVWSGANAGGAGIHGWHGSPGGKELLVGVSCVTVLLAVTLKASHGILFVFAKICRILFVLANVSVHLCKTTRV
jgi:hypothetical protein